MLRDLRQDAYDGRVYLPQERLTRHNVTLEDMRGREVAPHLKAALREFKDAVNEELRSALAVGAGAAASTRRARSAPPSSARSNRCAGLQRCDVAHRPGPDREAVGRVADGEKLS